LVEATIEVLTNRSITLQTFHKEDYYNPNFAVEDARSPREPWHDLHSKIDGPAAYDVLKNFEERWLKASKRSAAKKLSKLSRSHNDSLLWINKIPDMIGRYNHKQEEARRKRERECESGSPRWMA
jgi:phosphatidylserine/phosphatidylglycerophosphate/cardiolipin synthase-like enzyme